MWGRLLHKYLLVYSLARPWIGWQSLWKLISNLISFCTLATRLASILFRSGSSSSPYSPPVENPWSPITLFPVICYIPLPGDGCSDKPAARKRRKTEKTLGTWTRLLCRCCCWLNGRCCIADNPRTTLKIPSSCLLLGAWIMYNIYKYGRERWWLLLVTRSTTCV